MGARSFVDNNATPPPVDIAVWAAREDANFVKQLQMHCALLKRESGIVLVNFLDDIDAGTSSVNAIQRLVRANIRLPLISSSFFAALSINPDMEDASWAVGAQLQAYALKGEDYRVVPVHVRPIDQETYGEHPLAKIQGLPRSGRPIEAWRSADEAWAQVTQEIRGVLRQIGRLAPLKRGW